VGRERLQGKRRLWLESLKYLVVSFLISLSVCLSGLCVCVPVCLWSLPFLVWLGLGWVGMGLVVVCLVQSGLPGSDAKQGSCGLKCPWMGADWATI
jgi:hypothetical protein